MQVPATESHYWRAIGRTEALLARAHSAGLWLRGIGMARALCAPRPTSAPVLVGELRHVNLRDLDGATLCIAPQSARTPGPALTQLLRERAINIVTLPPSVLAALLSHAEFVRRLARSLLHDEAAAEDVVQETYLAALVRPPRVTGEATARAWLARVVRNLSSEVGRRRQQEGTPLGLQQIAKSDDGDRAHALLLGLHGDHRRDAGGNTGRVEC